MSAFEQILDLKHLVGQSIIGQAHVVERILLGLLANGNLLVEDLPGLAKTRAIKTLSKHLESDFNRIQFTPDLLPSDVTGTEIYLSEDAKERFVFRPGPIFANLVLADEINRAPAKGLEREKRYFTSMPAAISMPFGIKTGRSTLHT